MRNGKFHRRVAFAICTNPFHLPKNGRGGLKLVLKIMALKKWNTNFRPEKQDYLFSRFAALVDFPVGKTNLILSKWIFRKLFFRVS